MPKRQFFAVVENLRDLRILTNILGGYEKVPGLTKAHSFYFGITKAYSERKSMKLISFVLYHGYIWSFQHPKKVGSLPSKFQANK